VLRRYAIALTLLVPTAAAAFDIDHATVRVNPTGRDSVRLAGSLAGITVDGAPSIRVALDGVGFEVPLAAFARKRQKLRYRATDGEPGIASMRIDLRSGKFTAALKSLALGTIRSPLTVDVSAGDAAACAQLGLRDRKSAKRRRDGRPRPRRLVLAPRQGIGTSCAVTAPELRPPALLVGDAPTVTVRVRLPQGAAGDGVSLRTADDIGAPTGDPLCTLADDGDPAHGDAMAGDGVLSCVVTVDTAAPARSRLMVTAPIAAEATGRAASPAATPPLEGSGPTELRISQPITRDEIGEILRLQELGQSLCTANRAQYGSPARASLETLAALRAETGIESLRLVDESGGITLTYASGVVGSVCGGCEEVGTSAPAGRGPMALGTYGTLATAAGDEDATLITNRHVFIWDPGYFGRSEAEEIKALFENSTCPRFTVTLLKNQAASGDALAGMTDAGTVVLVSHGNLPRYLGSIGMNCLSTKDPVTIDLAAAIAADMQRQGVTVTTSEISGNISSTTCLSPWYFRRLPRFSSDAFIWGGYCFSGATSDTFMSNYLQFEKNVVSLVDAQADRGAHTQWGFNRKVSDQWARQLGVEVFTELVAKHRTTAETYAAVTPKLDPYNSVVSARFVEHPQFGAGMAYLKATLGPKDPAARPGDLVPLTLTLEGADDCAIQYRWRNTGVAGHLVDGDDHLTVSPQTTYEAGDVAGDLQDTVTVDVIDVAGPEPKTLLTRSITVRVSPSCLGCSEAGADAVAAGDTCTPAERCCADGEDNDDDDLDDCDDPDCATDPACAPAACTAPEDVVNVPSDDLREILHDELGVPAAEPLTCADMERLTSLFIGAGQIETLEGLQFAANLTQLTCNYCVIHDIGPLAPLQKLTELSLTNNGIVDVTPLAGHSALTYLDLGFNHVEDVAPLAGLTKLTYLSLWGNEVFDVSALAGMTQLEELYLRQNYIESVSALAGLLKVRVLTLAFNYLTTLAGLENMTALERLEVWDNFTLADIGALGDLDALSYLDARNNDIESIAALDGKQQLAYLDLAANRIADLSTVDWSGLPLLTNLDLDHNAITSIGPLENLSAIFALDVSYNRVSDATPLKDLTTLHQLSIRNNLVSDLQPLVDNSGIGIGDVINIQQNCLSTSDPDLQTLKNRGVTVEYHPQGCTP
jgi:Leucine-rich repeat (LRR) protein